MASKLHGVEVEIKIIKHKGDPITTTVDNSQYGDISNSCHKNDEIKPPQKLPIKNTGEKWNKL